MENLENKMRNSLEQIALDYILKFNKYEGNFAELIERNIRNYINMEFAFLSDDKKELLIPVVKYYRKNYFPNSKTAVRELKNRYNEKLFSMEDFFRHTNLVNNTFIIEFCLLKPDCPIYSYLSNCGIKITAKKTNTLILEYMKYLEEFPDKNLFEVVIQRWLYWHQITNK